VLLELDGVRVLTDPLLRSRVGHLRRQAPPVDPRWHRGVDAVLISHAHHDHLDVPSLRRLQPGTEVVVPAGVSRVLRRAGIERLHEVEVGDRLVLGGLEVEVTAAEHAGFRPPFGPSTDCVGYVVAGSQRVYFAGDTDLFPGMAELGALDVALLPVWGWGPTLGPGHLDPTRAARALRLLRPRVAVPIHWGTFWPIGLARSGPRQLVDPPRLFARHAARLAPAVDVRIAPPGGSLEIEGEG
jgi:L-ascorbate metabolism protein UlaG (beta-lactamase superfamily)